MLSDTFSRIGKLMPGVATNLGMFFLALFVLLIGMSKSATNIYDEGIIVYGAQRVADGDILYKDFWTMYGPAQFWVIGSLFKVFGSSILVERIWDVFVRALISLVAYLLAKRYANHYAALFVWSSCTLWLSYVDFYGFPAFPALLWSAPHFNQTPRL